MMGHDLPLRDRGMHPSLKLLHSLGFLCFSAKEACVVPAARTHWVEQLPAYCLLAALPCPERLGSKNHKAEMGKGQGNAE